MYSTSSDELSSVAVGEVNPQRAREATARYNVPRSYTDYRELLPQPFDDDAYMKFLPPNQPAIQQLAVTYFLAGYRFDRLGYYGSAFADPLAQGANESFRGRLDDIDRTIDYSNAKRRVAYPYLKPSLVLNSISI